MANDPALQAAVTGRASCPLVRLRPVRLILWVQGLTIAWMLIEAGVALSSAWMARSPALLAFGADSVVELLSAIVVLLQFSRLLKLSTEQAARFAGVLLLVLAAVVFFVSSTSLLYGIRPQTSEAGMAITIAALVIMPGLSWIKRKVANQTQNKALAADSVQSGMCAYLAAITLAGLAINAYLRVSWIDQVAALAALPILYLEGSRALSGDDCGCH
jgi:divalent metal cation (Fe/Co/Zn/Cd) transporter